MPIDPDDFTTSQQHALFDLLVLSMYADGHLTTFEDKHLQPLLLTMGCPEEVDRRRTFDDAVTRMQPSVQSHYKARTQMITLAETFTTRKQQQQVYAAVEDIMASDSHVTSWESDLLSELRCRFHL